ncbi:MAG: TolC family protein [Bacteroides thetaiotaomicron]
MKQIRYLFGGLLFLFASTGSVTAQEVSDYSKLQPNDYSSITLPPLDLLFENAKSAPTYELATVKEQIERKLLAKEKKAFLSFFSLRGSYQYGMFGNESTFTDVAIAPYLTYSTQAQKGYTVGAGVNIPLDGLFDLTARVKRQKLNVRTAQLERDVKFEEMKKEIIEMYATATAQLSILKLSAEALILSNVQYNIAEKNFSNGTIDSGELSAEKSRQSVAKEKFEKSKFELTKSLMILEVITRTSILNSK